ncbi:MAG: CPBP family intramembrane metalloprotease [Clostridiales Family XIII bacterium]|nr:CPBP family intramembrane metalloprotease [Clostridiales Family XIII bacterium]
MTDFTKKLGKTLLQIAVYLVLWALLLWVFRLPALQTFVNNAALNAVWVQLLSFAGLALITWLFIRFMKEKELSPIISKLPAQDALLGLIVGVLLAGGTLGLYIMTDSFSFGRWYDIDQFYLWVLAIIINVAAQEYVFRGYLFSLVQSRFGKFAAVGGSAILFALLTPYVLSGGTISILIAFAFNCLLSMLRLHTGGMLAPFVTHLIWQLSGGLLLSVLPNVSGYPSFTDDSVSGSGILSGGSLRFAGSALTFIVTLFLIDLAFILISDAKDKAKKKSS